MDCDQIQEILSAFLDHEESAGEIDNVLSHLYGCKECQRFFNAAVGLRNIAREERESFPARLDETVTDRVQRSSRRNLFSYRLKVPAYVVSAVVIILMAVSFTFGFVVQEDAHQKEMNTILHAPPSEVVYGMPAQLVYPAVNHQSKGGVR